MNGQRLIAAGIELSKFAPLIDGEVPVCGAPEHETTADGWAMSWAIAGGSRFTLSAERALGAPGDAWVLNIALDGATATIQSLGLRFARAGNVVRYLRNGYTSWDGSYFVEIANARPLVTQDPGALVGYAVTALVSEQGGVAVLGFLRHDQFQNRFRFAIANDPLSLDAETLLDGSVQGPHIEAESLMLLAGTDTEETLRTWARAVVAASPRSPRLREKRIAGWCSWYNLYASISEPVILEHLDAAARFRDERRAPLEVFQIDDGFTPEMGDWLDLKPQFPRGMKPLLDEIRARDFTPGLWIAPFMVGNRSRLFAEHPDWVVQDRKTQQPIAPMKFYGEFRWHKRSEEYYVLDITHPDAEAYIRRVFRTWTRDWGCGYFKTDFMFFGSEYGPLDARWHESGLSRMAIWMRMARLIREEIGEALWLTCGGPIWTPVGLVDAVRIGRDIGVTWDGHYSAESLLRDQASRNFGNGIFWQSDPDCILLRERFHELNDEQVRSLALFAAQSGGLLMTSDKLDELSPARAQLFAELARDSRVRMCGFPQLGKVSLRHHIGVSHTGSPRLMSDGDAVLVQQFRRADGVAMLALLNTGKSTAEREYAGEVIEIPPFATRLISIPGSVA